MVELVSQWARHTSCAAGASLAVNFVTPNCGPVFSVSDPDSPEHPEVPFQRLATEEITLLASDVVGGDCGKAVRNLHCLPKRA